MTFSFGFTAYPTGSGNRTSNPTGPPPTLDAGISLKRELVLSKEQLIDDREPRRPYWNELLGLRNIFTWVDRRDESFHIDCEIPTITNLKG